MTNQINALRVFFVFSVCLLAAGQVQAQSTNASMSGYVTDPSKAFIEGAKVTAVETGTNSRYVSLTDKGGRYTFSNLAPGQYRVEVEKAGFKALVKNDIDLHVQANIGLNFEMPVGSTADTVTVAGGEPLLQTDSASVGMVVDHEAVENMPLNGRSFQSLIELTPGVLTSNGQVNDGQFVVNGQRPDANYFTVDGVSANSGGFIAPGTGITGGSPGFSGNMGALTALGTTQSLASVDAMQEFRVQTSTYSAEYGRQPGGQISIVTRSGTNQWHGSAYDYLRNGVLDANNWFANQNGTPRATEHQNDFGGTLGGPLTIPHIYNGANKTFFFFSYEGLRQIQPVFQQGYVPSLALRQQTAPALQPFINAFPIPNGPNLGNGLAIYNGDYSNRNDIDTAAIRIDQQIGSRWTLFGRYNWSPSSTWFRSNLVGDSQAVYAYIPQRLYTTTAGLTGILTPHLNNDLRFNYSSTFAEANRGMDNFGGAVPQQLSSLLPAQYASTPIPGVLFELFFPGYAVRVFLQNGLNTQIQQYNIVDTLSYTAGSHQFKFGVDWRRLRPEYNNDTYYESIVFTNQTQLLTGTVPNGYASVYTELPSGAILHEFSAFAQDHWKLSSKLTLDLGLRWDINPAPGAVNGEPLLAVNEITNFSQMALQPLGTHLYGTRWNNFAPRVGAAYQIGSRPGYETVLRAGFGVFYDTGNAQDTLGLSFYPFDTSTTFGGVYPFTTAQQTAPAPGYPNVTPPYGTIAIFDPNLKTPYTLEWSAAVQQAIGKNQTFTASYVGNGGRRLLATQIFNIAALNPKFGTIQEVYGGGFSSYNALQLQYQRRLAQGLQVQASYTWSHSIDNESADSAANLPPTKGNSNFDLPQLFASSIIYNIPSLRSGGVGKALLGGWSIDTGIHAQSGYPLSITATQTLNPATGGYNVYFPNLVPNVPIYLYGAACAASDGGNPCPGGMRINPAAFSTPPAGTNGDLGRNILRGLGSWEVNAALQRQFKLTEKFNLLFRVESFNLFNHPSFGSPVITYGAANFGLATTTLNAALSSVSSLYQMGAPRSFQFALKLRF